VRVFRTVDKEDRPAARAQARGGLAGRSPRARQPPTLRPESKTLRMAAAESGSLPAPPSYRPGPLTGIGWLLLHLRLGRPTWRCPGAAARPRPDRGRHDRSSRLRWAVRAFAGDHGVSGSREKRPALETLLAAVRARRVDVVACVTLDRLARSTHHLVTLAKELEALGVDLVVLDQAIDTTTPSGWLLFVGRRRRVRAGLDSGPGPRRPQTGQGAGDAERPAGWTTAHAAARCRGGPATLHQERLHPRGRAAARRQPRRGLAGRCKPSRQGRP